MKPSSVPGRDTISGDLVIGFESVNEFLISQKFGE